MRDFLREELEREYDMELEGIVSEIKKQRAKTVLIQLPDGLKKKATKMADFIEKSTKAKCLIWIGSCFGACDTPNLGRMEKKIDLLIQFGHNNFSFKK